MLWLHYAYHCVFHMKHMPIRRTMFMMPPLQPRNSKWIEDFLNCKYWQLSTCRRKNLCNMCLFVLLHKMRQEMEYIRFCSYIFSLSLFPIHQQCIVCRHTPWGNTVHLAWHSKLGQYPPPASHCHLASPHSHIIYKLYIFLHKLAIISNVHRFQFSTELSMMLSHLPCYHTKRDGQSAATASVYNININTQW